MSVWLPVSSSELKEPIEIETEDDGKLLLTSVTSFFPGTTALKFRCPGSQAFCEITAVEGNFLPPQGGWVVSTRYIAVTGVEVPTFGSASSHEEKDENAVEMVRQRVTHQLNEKGGEGPLDEGCLEKDEENRVSMEEKDVGERNMGDVDKKETQRMQDKERVQETGMMRDKNGVQEASKDISQVSSILN